MFWQEACGAQVLAVFKFVDRVAGAYTRMIRRAALLEAQGELQTHVRLPARGRPARAQFAVSTIRYFPPPKKHVVVFGGRDLRSVARWRLCVDWSSGVRVWVNGHAPASRRERTGGREY